MPINQVFLILQAIPPPLLFPSNRSRSLLPISGSGLLLVNSCKSCITELCHRYLSALNADLLFWKCPIPCCFIDDACTQTLDLSLGQKKKKKLSCFRKSAGWNFFHHLPARIVECVSEYVFFVSKKQKKKKTTEKQKTKETRENRKAKETNEEREKKNVVVVNNICGKSNRIRWHCLTFCSVYF